MREVERLYIKIYNHYHDKHHFIAVYPYVNVQSLYLRMRTESSFEDGCYSKFYRTIPKLAVSWVSSSLQGGAEWIPEPYQWSWLLNLNSPKWRIYARQGDQMRHRTIKLVSSSDETTFTNCWISLWLPGSSAGWSV